MVRTDLAKWIRGSSATTTTTARTVVTPIVRGHPAVEGSPHPPLAVDPILPDGPAGLRARTDLRAAIRHRLVVVLEAGRATRDGFGDLALGARAAPESLVVGRSRRALAPLRAIRAVWAISARRPLASLDALRTFAPLRPLGALAPLTVAAGPAIEGIGAIGARLALAALGRSRGPVETRGGLGA
ncbi:MAG: hypothetical protein HZB39_18445, partial [Planctomycetes bacterium]|nr:hypothetical protein [Planctomycetota bacterium]